MNPIPRTANRLKEKKTSRKMLMKKRKKSHRQQRAQLPKQRRQRESWYYAQLLADTTWSSESAERWSSSCQMMSIMTGISTGPMLESNLNRFRSSDLTRGSMHTQACKHSLERTTWLGIWAVCRNTTKKTSASSPKLGCYRQTRTTSKTSSIRRRPKLS